MLLDTPLYLALAHAGAFFLSAALIVCACSTHYDLKTGHKISSRLKLGAHNERPFLFCAPVLYSARAVKERHLEGLITPIRRFESGRRNSLSMGNGELGKEIGRHIHRHLHRVRCLIVLCNTTGQFGAGRLFAGPFVFMQPFLHKLYVAGAVALYLIVFLLLFYVALYLAGSIVCEIGDPYP